MQKRILIVGERPVAEHNLGGHKGNESNDWSFQRVRTSLEAMAALRQAEYTAVVADARLAGGVSGGPLLDEVFRQQPQCLRFIRADLRERTSETRKLGAAHRLLMGTFDLETLQQVVMNALEVEIWLPVEKVQGLLGRMHQLPSPPGLYFEVVNQLQSPTASLDEIGETISRDQAMTAKLLQLANSAAFGLQFQVSHPAEALSYLGLETAKSMILLAHTFSRFDNPALSGLSVGSLWQHSLTTARYAQKIAQLESAGSELSAQSFTAGLLHDVGQLMLAANLPAQFQQAVQLASAHELELWQAELEVLGTHHAEIGACLLANWGLPNPIIEAVGLHHQPVRFSSASFPPLVSVHAANVWARTSHGSHAYGLPPQLDMEYLLGCGCADHVSEWQRSLINRAEPARAAVGL